MPIYLRQSTALQEVPLGFFVDSTDGNTEKTGLTIANTDILVWKNGATSLVAKNSGGATHISNGIYYCVLDTTDTNTAGPLVLFVHVAGALPVRVECVVLPSAIYDAWVTGSVGLAVNVTQFGGSNGTFSGGRPEVNVSHISGDSVAADNLEAALDGTGGVTITAAITGNITGNLSGSVGSVTAMVSANVTQISGDTTAADNAESFFDGTGYAGTNNVIPTVTAVTNLVTANVTQISGDATAADNLEAALDGTGGVTITAAITGNITGNLSGSVGSVTAMVSANVTQLSGDATAADNAESFFDGTGYAGTNNVIPTVTTVTNAVAANVTHFGGTAGTFAGGRPEVNTTHVGGTAQTARDLGAGVLLTPGTGTGQIALTSGQVTVGTNTDKSGYALSASGNSAIWDFLSSSIDDVGSIGLLIKTNLDAAVSTRLASASYTAPPTANQNADAVLARNVSNVEGTAGEHTLCTIVLAMLESSTSGTTWTIKRTDGTTTHATKTLTLDAAADPITGVS